MKRTRPRGWIRFEDLPDSPKARAVRADIFDRFHQHNDEDTLPRGGRGIFYDLRPHGMPGNARGVTYLKYPTEKGRNSMQASPEYVQDQLAWMRRVWNRETEEWLINEEWISDSRAPAPIGPNECSDAELEAMLIALSIEQLHSARQAGQSVCLEIWCEAADLMPRIARVASDYGVKVYSGGGMDGLKPKKEAAERAARREVPTMIGHLADYDKHGGYIRNAFEEDSLAFCDWHREHEDAPGSISIVPLGLTLAQAQAHDLLDAYGKAELDGLPVPVLDAIVRNFIESNLDMKIQRQVIKAEPDMRLEVARQVLRKLKKPK